MDEHRHLSRPRWRRATLALGTIVAIAVTTLSGTSTTVSAQDGTATPTSDVGPLVCPSIPTTHDPNVIKIVYKVGVDRNVSDKVMLAGFEAGWVESRMNNLPCGEDDSLGVFQQRPSWGWGTPEQIMDVAYASTQFFSRAQTNEPRYPHYTAGQLAQSVQRSCCPARYDQAETKARALIEEARRLVNPTPFTGSSADFNGDGRDDVVTFTQNNLADVYVALSSGTEFVGREQKWHDYFAPAGETPLTGDVNGDGKDDIITFTHGPAADVYVALSTGTGFGPGVKWHDYFSPSGEVPAVGDVNGDGKADIVTFTRNNLADVYVALSTGTGFGPGVKWHDYFAVTGEHPGVGDVNGDGKADLITFTQGTSADVYAALSTGTGFGPGVKWHDYFAIAGEAPRVGDFNGDGATDIATFTNNAAGDVYVALSNKTNAFLGTTIKWHDYFAPSGEFPYTGDYNGDGKTDIVTFTHTPSADVYTALSTGTTFGPGTKWHDFFGLPGETSL